MKMKNGFTLIELLAVIVILAIIALITTPTILNVIEESRLNSAIDKAWGTIEATKTAYTRAQITNPVGLPYTVYFDKTFIKVNNPTEDINYTINQSTGEGTGNGYVMNQYISVSGDKPESGDIIIRKDGTLVAQLLKFGKYYCSTVNKKKEIDANKMRCSRNKKDLYSEKAIDILKAEVVSSGDGIYKDVYENERYVFKGGKTGNYIKLDDDLYRIMSLESDGTLKVIKNKPIGSMVFDPGYSISINGVTNSNSIDGTRYSNNPSDYCYASDIKSYYGCNIWGSKTTTLDSSGNNITSILQKNLPSSESYLNIYLNTTWYNSFSTDVKDIIVEHVFNLGLVNGGSNQTLGESIKQENEIKWKGKIGLMTISDYIKGSTNSNCVNVNSYYYQKSCYNDGETYNYLTNSKTMWTLTRYAGSGYLYTVRSDYNSLSNGGASNIDAVFPVFYLSSNITLSGAGTENDPYVID